MTEQPLTDQDLDDILHTLADGHHPAADDVRRLVTDLRAARAELASLESCYEVVQSERAQAEAEADAERIARVAAESHVEALQAAIARAERAEWHAVVEHRWAMYGHKAAKAEAAIARVRELCQPTGAPRLVRTSDVLRALDAAEPDRVRLNVTEPFTATTVYVGAQKFPLLEPVRLDVGTYWIVKRPDGMWTVEPDTVQ